MENGKPSQAAIGRELGISAPQMVKLKKQGMPVHLGAEACRLWRSARQNIAQRKKTPEPERIPYSANDESHDQARTRREIAEANLAELKLAEQRKQLVRAADVRSAVSKRAAALRESLMQLPARAVPLLVAEPNAASMERILRAEIVSALEQLNGD